MTRVHARLSGTRLSVEAAARFVADPSAGATVTFTGVVRDHAEGRSVEGLDYEAYEEAALRRMEELARSVAERWPDVRAIWMEHRTGTLDVGEVAVVVATSAGHRDAAFEAARHGIDELKATAPIWKRERWADGGSHWPGTD